VIKVSLVIPIDQESQLMAHANLLIKMYVVIPRRVALLVHAEKFTRISMRHVKTPLCNSLLQDLARLDLKRLHYELINSEETSI